MSSLSLYDLNNNKATKDVATTISDGLLSSADKQKLDGIAANANNYVLPVASTILGGIKSGTDITVDANGNVTVNNADKVDGIQGADLVKKDGSIAMNNLTVGTRTGTVGTNSFAQGNNCEASGNYSHAEGYNTTASSSYSHAEGGGTTASNTYSHAEGNGTIASGSNSHAEGTNTTASGKHSHAEGNGTTASGTSSHAEGGYTTASGYYSHAEGYSTTASGDRSHAQNTNTKAQGYAQTVIGRYNIAQGTGTSMVATDDAFIIGNGTSESLRRNAFKVTFDGKAWTQEGYYVGASNDKVWHEGNDGSGSGLDADTVDGIHANDFIQKNEKITLPASTTDTAYLNLPNGNAPYSPKNGDIWQQNNNFYTRLNNSTKTIYHNGNAPTANLSTVSQTDAEAGTNTTRYAWTPERVHQAINANLIKSPKLFANTSGIKGTGTGQANESYFEFNEADGTTRQGYIGFGSENDNILTIANTMSNGNVNISTTGKATVNGNEILRANTLSMIGDGSYVLGRTSDDRSIFAFLSKTDYTTKGYVGFNDNLHMAIQNYRTNGDIKLITAGTGKVTVNSNEILTTNTGCRKYIMGGRQKTQRIFSVPKTQTCGFDFELVKDGIRQQAQSILDIHFGLFGNSTAHFTQAYRTGAKPEEYTLHFLVYDDGTNLNGYIVSDNYIDEWTIVEKHNFNMDIEIVNVGSNTYVPSGTKVFDSDTDSIQILDTNTISNSALNLANASGIKGTGTGASNLSYFNFFENNGTTRQGYIGYGDSAGTLFIWNELNTDVYIKTSGAGKAKVNGNEIWHAGNDGSSSGLDADLLDGQHGSYYAKASDVSANTANISAIMGVKTATIGTSWTGSSAPYTQTISVSGVTANDKPIICPVYSTTNSTAIAQQQAWNMIGKITTNNGSITVTCFEEKPTTAIPIQIKGV